MIAENLDLFFADFGVSASWNGNTQMVIIDAATEDLLGGRVISTDYVMSMPAEAFPEIAKDAQIVVGVTFYRVREVRFVTDGAIKELSVSKL